MLNRLPYLVLFAVLGSARQIREIKVDDLGDDYTDFAEQGVKNGGANHKLKLVTYSTLAPKLEIPTRAPTIAANSPPKSTPSPSTTKRPVYDYRRGYFFQHYPWDRLPRRYLMRPGMTYVYPPQYQYVNYRYPALPYGYQDPYNIYRSHPGIGNANGCDGGGCGGSYNNGGCGGDVGGCGGSGGRFEDSYEDDEDYEDGKSGEAKINKKDPLEDLELEDLEKLSKSGDEENHETGKMNEDEDLVDDVRK